MTEFPSGIIFTISFHFGTVGIDLKAVYNESHSESKKRVNEVLKSIKIMIL